MPTVFIDVDTQFDFLLPAGALSVPGAELVLPAIAKLNQSAAARGITIVSTVDAHTENDPEFASWPPHCISGTLGQQKPVATLVANQIIFSKQTTDAFLNPAFLPLLATLNADHYVVYGVATEVCVRFAALGLLKTGKPVTVVTDAIRHLTDPARDAFVAELTSAGGKVTTVSALGF